MNQLTIFDDFEPIKEAVETNFDENQAKWYGTEQSLKCVVKAIIPPDVKSPLEMHRKSIFDEERQRNFERWRSYASAIDLHCKDVPIEKRWLVATNLLKASRDRGEPCTMILFKRNGCSDFRPENVVEYL